MKPDESHHEHAAKDPEDTYVHYSQLSNNTADWWHKDKCKTWTLAKSHLSQVTWLTLDVKVYGQMCGTASVSAESLSSTDVSCFPYDERHRKRGGSDIDFYADDGSLMNGLQPLEQWQVFLDYPESYRLGAISASLFFPSIL